jgi:hypothetical protein
MRVYLHAWMKPSPGMAAPVSYFDLLWFPVQSTKLPILIYIRPNDACRVRIAGNAA